MFSTLPYKTRFRKPCLDASTIGDVFEHLAQRAWIEMPDWRFFTLNY
jgi:hypothetical protein